MDNRTGHTPHKEKDVRSTLIELLRSFSVPELCAEADVSNALDPGIVALIAPTKIVGSALTLRVSLSESSLVPHALAMANTGDVLVMEASDASNLIPWNANRSLIAHQLRLAGAVVDGALQSFEGYQRTAFPIFARSLPLGDRAPSEEGAVNVPVSCGGVWVHPGDIIVGDVSGVCVIPEEQAEYLMQTIRERQSKYGISSKLYPSME